MRNINWLALLGLENRLNQYLQNAAQLRQIAKNRAELFSIEWILEKRRLERLLFLAVLTAGLMMLALMMSSFATIIHFWDTPKREFVAWCVAGVWFLFSVVVWWLLINAASEGDDAFARTREELKRDWLEYQHRFDDMQSAQLDSSASLTSSASLSSSDFVADTQEKK